MPKRSTLWNQLTYYTNSHENSELTPLRSGGYTENANWSNKVSLGVSDGKDKIIVFLNSTWIGDIAFTAKAK